MANIECTYEINLRERRKCLENLPWFPKCVAKIIVEYELPSRNDRLAILFHGRTGIRHVSGLTIFWQNAKPNGRTWYYFRYGGYQSRPLRLKYLCPKKNPFSWACAPTQKSMRWLWNTLHSCRINSDIYNAYTRELLELMEYI
jgi:hypothetical protein